jgi:hypothetical protein
MSNQHVMNEVERVLGAREYRFDFNKNDVLENGAALVTLLAFSESEDTEEQRADVEASLCALTPRATWSDLDAPAARELLPVPLVDRLR